jgi:hypothetical protein
MPLTDRPSNTITAMEAEAFEVTSDVIVGSVADAL